MPRDPREPLHQFVAYAARLAGDEKGEAQVFLDRLFQAFGHAGYKEAGAVLESRVRAAGKGTRFADLLWTPRVLIEMKKHGENLLHHYDQARDYWHDTYPKPRYVILCNFDEFWIYDFFNQSDPVDTLRLDDLPRRYLALNFLFPEDPRPQFGKDRVRVSREAAAAVADVFNSLIARGEDRQRAQRFVLQCVFCLFAEDFDLLPRGLFSGLIEDCAGGADSYDLFGSLFNQMNARQRARGGRYKDVDYFNGGLFAVVDPIELNAGELALLAKAARQDWSLVQPPIFGALFEGSMGKDERHAYGAHFTAEADIKKVVRPTIERPWTERIEAAKTLKELTALREELLAFQVLDPACGCGNFLYVAYRELRRLEMRILLRIHDEFGKRAREQAPLEPKLSLRQFHGIDILPFAVELTKLTLILGKEQAIRETRETLRLSGVDADLLEQALPLDSLDDNIVCDDALFCDWPKADVIIGNPPFMDARKLTMERGIEYANRVRKKYLGVPGRADYCVYWFRRVHNELLSSGRAGLVGTNTIRQNYSREGGLDYILSQGGTITEAISTQPWSGEAHVFVSIVNWIKGECKGPFEIKTQEGHMLDGPWRKELVSHIPATLSSNTQIESAHRISACAALFCFEGIQPAHDGFRLDKNTAKEFCTATPNIMKYVHPYINGRDLVTGDYKRNPCFLLDFSNLTLLEAMAFGEAFRHLKTVVLPDWEANAASERKATGKARGEHQNRLQTWWQLKRPRQEMVKAIARLTRFIVCSRVTKRPIFEFLCSKARPDSSLTVFSASDDYSFGVLQSPIHWKWFTARCSTLKGDFRYTSNTVFDTFPWPQSPTLKQAQAVAKAAVDLRAFRREIMRQNNWSLRDLYRTLETPGKNPLRDAHALLDAAVRAAYGMNKDDDPLAFLLNLNHEVAERETHMQSVVGPGLPPCVGDPGAFISEDCIRVEEP